MSSDLKEQLQHVLSDAYAIERELGGGGMSRVFLATESALGRRVVLKVLPPDLAGVVSADRFRREITLAAQLQHPHIVPVLAAGSADIGGGAVPFYTMPFVDGESLRARLSREGELPVNDAVHILRDVAAALEHAHARGIVHRDIKPENILLSGRHSVVTDFGVAKALTSSVSANAAPRDAPAEYSLTSLGVALGTPTYMAPEQGAGDPATDHRADLYALGCLAYEMLAGEPPFAGRSPAQLLAAHATQTPESVIRRRPAVPVPLDSLVSRLLAKRPADRPQSAAEVIRELDTLATPNATLATPNATASLTVPVAAPRSRGSRRRLFTLGGVVALAAGLVAISWVARARAAAHAGTNRVAVAPLDNRTGDPALDQIGAMTADWLSSSLSRMGLLKVADLQAVMTAMADARRAGASPVERIADRTGASTVVTGNYYRSGDSIRVQISITDAATGNILQTLDPVLMPADDPVRGFGRLREQLLGAFSTLFDPRFKEWNDPHARPPSYDAYQEYMLGVREFNETGGDPMLALGHLQRAAALDTSFVQPRLWIAWMLIEREPHGVDSILRTLDRVRQAFTPLEAAWVTRMRARLDRDPEASYRAARNMAELAPGSSWMIALVNAALETNRPRVALQAADDMQWLGPEVRMMYRSIAHHMLGDYAAQLNDGKALTVKQSAVAAILELSALAALGRTDEVLQRLDELEAMASGLGIPFAMLEVASELRVHGHPEAAAAARDRALSRLRQRSIVELRDRRELNVLAGVLLETKRYAEADSLARTMLAQAPSDVNAVGFATLLAAARADTAVTQLDARLARMQDMAPRGTVELWRARVAATLGRDADALALLEASSGSSTEWWMAVHVIPEFDRFRNTPAFERLTRPKG